MFSLRLFGGASLEGPDGVLTGRATQRHRLALLALLATAGRGGVSRDKLIAYLWPELDTERARHLLSNCVYVLRQALGDTTLVSATDAIRLDLNRLRCDVHRFEEALARGDFGGAVALYSGPFLDGFFLSENPEFEQWVERERGRLADSFLRALEALAEAAEGERNFRSAAEWWKARAAQAPLDSRVALRLMQALEAGGNRAAALQHGAVHQRLLQEELGLGPAPEVTALVERLRREAATDPPERGRSSATPAGGVEGVSAPAGAEAEWAAQVGSRSDQPVRLTSGTWGAGGAIRRWKWPGVTALLALMSLAGAVWAGWARHPAPERSIVVLPFVTLGAEDDGEHFGDGLTEEIITRLAAIAELKVISRTSAMHYKGSSAPLRQIADELDVAHVLEGSVRRSDGRLRITAQLIDARADEHLWAQSYDYEPRDIFRVQEEIAREVVRALEVELGERGRSRLARQGTRDPQAYDDYRRGRFFWSTRTKEGHDRALHYFERAIERDSTYADAYAGLADAYMTAYQFNLSSAPEAEVYSRLKWAAERALALDEQSAEAHASFAIVLWWQRNWPGVERELRRALELNPGNASARSWYALLLAGMGRVEEALEESRRAYELDPFGIIASITHAHAWYLARDYDRAIEQYRRTLELNDSWAPAYAQMGLAYAQKGMHRAAIREVSRAVELRPNDSAWLADLAYVQALAKQTESALHTLRRSQQQPSAEFHIARAYVALGEPDSAFAWLERSSWQYPHRAVRGDPALDPLRSDPRFARLEERVEREMGMR